MRARNIVEVIELLDEVISASKEESSPVGYFAALYRRVTVSVQKHLERGDFFDDNERMEELDVVFANRYFSAYRAYLKDERTVACWQVAFEATRDRRVMVLQHLLVAMNAHIGFDLGIAAAEVAKGKSIHALEQDFMRINQLLSAEVDTVQYLLGRFTPFLALVDWLGGHLDEGLAQFSMDIARDRSWQMAMTLADITDEHMQRTFEHHRDQRVASFGRRLHRPKVPFKWLVRVLSALERRTISQRIAVLSGE